MWKSNEWDDVNLVSIFCFCFSIIDQANFCRFLKLLLWNEIVEWWFTYMQINAFGLDALNWLGNVRNLHRLRKKLLKLTPWNEWVWFVLFLFFLLIWLTCVRVWWRKSNNKCFRTKLNCFTFHRFTFFLCLKYIHHC